MLEVDFSNAFNMIDRTEMLVQVYRSFPPCTGGLNTVILVLRFWCRFMRSFPPCTGGLNTVILVLLTCFLGTVYCRVRQNDGSCACERDEE